MIRSYRSGDAISVSRASPRTMPSRWPQLREIAEEIRIARDADHLRVDLEERPALAIALVAGDAAGAETDHRDAVEAAAADAGRIDGIRNRTADVVVAQRRRAAGHRLARCVAHMFGAVDRGAVEQQAMGAGRRFRRPDARRRSCAPSRWRSRPPATSPVTAKASTTSPKNRAGSLAWNSMKPASTTSATWSGNSAATGSRTSSTKRNATTSAASDERQRSLLQQRTELPAEHARQQQQRSSDQDRIFVGVVEHVRRDSPAKMPPSTPPNEVHR